MTAIKAIAASTPAINVMIDWGVQSLYSMGCSPCARSFPPRSVRPAGGSSPGATERASGRLAGDQPGGLRSPSGAICRVAWRCDTSSPPNKLNFMLRPYAETATFKVFRLTLLTAVPAAALLL